MGTFIEIFSVIMIVVNVAYLTMIHFEKPDGVVKVVQDEEDGSSYLFLELYIPIDELASRKKVHFGVWVGTPRK